jgi:hypothetical protein
MRGILTDPARSPARAHLSNNSARDAPDPDESAAIGRVDHADHLDSGTGMRRMHHATVADVDANVPEPRKKQQVAGPHSRTCYLSPPVIEFVRAVREHNADSPVRPVDEPRAVEPTGRRCASPSVRDADLPDGDRRGTLAEGRQRNCSERSVPSGRLSGYSVRRADAGAAEGDRGKRERQQGAAEGGRQEERERRGRKTGDCAAPGLFLSVGS